MDAGISPVKNPTPNNAVVSDTGDLPSGCRHVPIAALQNFSLDIVLVMFYANLWEKSH